MKPSRPRVVVVGGGFAGVEAARMAATAPVDVLLIDKTNHHLFQPLLYQVATAALSPAEIACPTRQLFKDIPNVAVVLGEVTGLDLAQQCVVGRTELGFPAERRIPFDYLVLATGLRTDYFGHDNWKALAPGLKTLRDATRIRADILGVFEAAESEPDPAKRESLLRFMIIGGGPTGCEIAGAIAEMARVTLPKEFRRIDSRAARIFLVEAGPRLLPTFHPSLAQKAHRALEKMGVEIVLGQPVMELSPGRAMVGKTPFFVHVVLWAAGVRSTAVGQWLAVPTDRAGRVLVNPDCSVPGYPTVFVVGDAMRMANQASPLPGVAQVALQQGRYVGRVIASLVERRPAPPPFQYHNKGNMAALGRNFALIEVGRLRLSGRFAFYVWGIVHIFFLVNLHNRILVFLRWMWTYFTHQRMARLIVNDTSEGEN
jgi:NADH dehydrogenase